MDYGFISVYIDGFTPCLKDNAIGELIDTEVIRIKRSSFLEKYNKKNGWYIDWSQLSGNSEIYALVIIGGHLFSIAGKKSVEYGYGGEVFGFAADQELLEHYVKNLGAEPICMLHQFHFGIFEDKMKKIMEVYTYEWTDEQL